MNINQNENSGFEKKLFVGAGQVRVVAINPTRKELAEVMGREYTEDPEKEDFVYVKEDVEVKFIKDGEEKTTTATRVFVDVWVQEVKSEEFVKVRFMLTQSPQTNKDGTKTQYINQVGQSTWVDEEDNLPEWFTHFIKKDKQGNVLNTSPKTYRVAMRGESDLMDFLQKWSNLNIWEQSSDILISNVKKFWRGDMYELQTLVDMLENNTVMIQFGVRSTIKTDDQGNEETVEYQSAFTKAFMTGNSVKDFNFQASRGFAGIKDVRNYELKNFYKNVWDEEYGFKDYTVKGYFQPYDPEHNPVNGESALVEEDSVSY